MSKPWVELCPNTGNWWTASSNPRPKKDCDPSKIMCYYLIQECNMAGVYHRIFTWYKNDDTRYFQIKNNQNWHFPKDFKDYNVDGELVVNNYQNTYKVIIHSIYVKIFELVE